MAVTDLAADMATVQVPVPVQAPDQPEKLLPDAATALRVTLVPETNEAVQAEPQEIPVGVLLTVPEPVPLRLTVRA